MPPTKYNGQLRQHPDFDKPHILQQWNSADDEWQEAFDFAKVRTVSDLEVANYITNMATTLAETRRQFDQHGFPSDLQYDGSPSDSTRDKILCMSVDLLAGLVLDMHLKAGEAIAKGKNTLFNFVGDFGGGVAAGASVGTTAGALALGLSPVGWIAVAGAAVFVVGKLLSTGFVTAVADLTAYRNDLRCLMIDNFKGRSLTRSVFITGFSGINSISGLAPYASELQPFLEDMNVYLQFLSFMNQAFEFSDHGLLPDCEDCGEPPTTHPIVIFHPGGEAGGFWTQLEANKFRFTATESGGYHRVAFQYDNEDRCVRLVSISISVTIAPGFQGYYSCGANPVVDGYLVGGVGSPALEGGCYAAISITHTGPFTADYEFAADC